MKLGCAYTTKIIFIDHTLVLVVYILYVVCKSISFESHSLIYILAAPKK